MTERSSNFRPRREAPRETPENLIVGRNAVREALNQQGVLMYSPYKVEVR